MRTETKTPLTRSDVFIARYHASGISNIQNPKKLLPHPPRHRRRGHAKAHTHGENQRKHRFRKPDCRYRIRAKVADPENVHHSEQRFKHHLQDHGNGEQEDGSIQTAGGIVLSTSPQSLPHRRPKRRRPNDIDRRHRPHHPMLLPCSRGLRTAIYTFPSTGKLPRRNPSQDG